MTPLESKAHTEALNITTAFQSFLDSMRENPGKTFTMDLAGLIEKAILRVAADSQTAPARREIKVSDICREVHTCCGSNCEWDERVCAELSEARKEIEDLKERKKVFAELFGKERKENERLKPRAELAGELADVLRKYSQRDDIGHIAGVVDVLTKWDALK